MHIQPGERIPEAILQFIEGGVHKVDTTTLFAHRRMVLISVPGAFTPTCSERHLPDYIAHFDAFQTRGIALACMAVNDPFVMQAWAREQHVPHGMRMLADGNAEFTRALGLEFDASGFGMGTRSRRFALVAEDGVVRHLAVEPNPGLDVSAAEKILEVL